MSTRFIWSAGAWVEAASIDPGVAMRWPEYRATLVAVERVDPTELVAAADELVQHAMASVHPDSGDDLHIVSWREVYTSFGVKPRVARSSVDALVRRAVSDNGLPRINTLVDIYNALSVLYRVPIGGEDLDRYRGAPRLVLASGTELFATVRDGSPSIDFADVGEPVWVDDDGITCRRWNWRQTSRTAIQAETHSVGFIIDSLPTGHQDAALAAAAIVDLMPSAHTRTLDAGRENR